MPRSPMDLLLDRVDWRCTQCGMPQREGCHCWDRFTPAQKQALCDAVRMQVRALLKTTCPGVWAHRSARTSLLNCVWTTVHAGLGRLDAAARPGAPLTADEGAEVAWRVCRDLAGYWLSMYPTVYATMAPAFLVRFLTQVDTIVQDVLREAS
jgi:hypothetical protein